MNRDNVYGYVRGGQDDDYIQNFDWVSLTIDGQGGDDHLANAGHVGEHMEGGLGDDTLINTGTVDLAMSGGDGGDTLDNQGTVGGTGDDYTVYGLSGGDGPDQITNSGTVNTFIHGDGGDDLIDNSGWTHRPIKGGPGNDQITSTGVTAQIDGGPGKDEITNSGTITAIYGVDPSILGGNGIDTITNSGEVDGDIAGGIGNDHITNTASGIVHGSIARDYGADTILNAGLVEGHIIQVGDYDDQITNTGTVEGFIDAGGGKDTITNSGEVGQYIYAGEGKDSITNSAIVHEYIDGDDGNDEIVNTGVVWDYITGGQGNDVIWNSGTVIQSIYGGLGNDQVHFQGGRVLGQINGGADSDTLYLALSNVTVLAGSTPSSGSATYWEAGETRTVSWTNFEQVIVTGTDQADQITIEATAEVTAILPGEGADTITNDGLVTPDIDAGAGNDTVTVAGSVQGQVLGADGEDIITVSGGGAVVSTLDGGAGNDSVTVGGLVQGEVLGADGEDVITLSAGGTVLSTLDGGAGNDSITVGGTVLASVEGADGDDSITINGAGDVAGAVTGGEGDDTLTNRGHVWGNLDGWSGNDHVDNQGEVDGNILGSAGDDQIQNSGTVHSSVAGGLGDDQITNSGTVDQFIEGFDGNDTMVNLGTVGMDMDAGAGDDTIHNMGAVGGDISGGAGDDQVTFDHGSVGGTILAGDDSDVLYLRLPDLTVLTGSDPSAGSAHYDDGTTAGTVSWADFESILVEGTPVDDTITIEAGATVTSIHTGGGNDTITTSGTVNEEILGGAGADEIHFRGGSVGRSIDGGGDAGDVLFLAVQEVTVLRAAAPAAGSARYDDGVQSGLLNWVDLDELRITGTAGSDTVRVRAQAVVTQISTGTGEDSIWNRGTVTLNLSGGADDDVIENRGTVGGYIDGFAGDDLITNYGTAQNILAWSGDDVIINYGTVTGDVMAEAGNDSITNEGTVGGDIEGGSGDDTVYFSDGRVGGTVLGGETGEVNGDTFYLLVPNPWFHPGSTFQSGAADYRDSGGVQRTVNWDEFEQGDIATPNTPPSLDLDADDSSGTGYDYSTTFTEDGSPVSISDSDVAISDPDGPFLYSAVITLTNPLDGDHEALSLSGDLPHGLYSGGYDPDTGTLTISGRATLADYESAIELVCYSDASQDPDDSAPRTIEVQVYDARDWSNTAISTITVVPVNDAPTTTGIPDVQVQEESGPTVINLHDHFDDAEDTDNQLVYTIENNTNPGLFSQVRITSWDTLRLNYAQDANGTADITIRATDTGGLWVDTTFTVTVTPVNDAPVVTAPGHQAVDEDIPLSIAGVSVSDVDAEGGSETVTLTASHGVLDLSASGGVTLTGNGTASVTLHGTITDLNGTLSSLVYTPEQDYHGSDTIDVSVNDNGHSGDGGPLTAAAQIAVSVYPVNDLPSIDPNEVPHLTVDEDHATTLTLTGHDADLVDTANAHFVVDGTVVENASAGWSMRLAHGTLTTAGPVVHDGTGEYSQQFTFVPDPDWNGRADIPYSFDTYGNQGEFVDGAIYRAVTGSTASPSGTWTVTEIWTRSSATGANSTPRSS